MAEKAASYAATIRESLDAPVEMVHGRRGQFDVLVHDRVVATRKGGLIAKFTKRPWPEAADVVAAVRAAIGSPE